jgi:glycosyltransferase 2 family protein
LQVHRNKKLLKSFVKIIFSVSALFFVFKKIDPQETLRIFLNANFILIFLALILYNISKMISAVRLLGFFRIIGLRLSSGYNLRLYYLGMFYNLFLPGGIGGDAYKVYLLKRFYSIPVKHLLSAALLDRISGMFMLSAMAFLFALWSSIPLLHDHSIVIIILGLLLSVPMLYLLFKVLFKKFMPVFLSSNLLSFGVQGLQVLCSLLILFSLGVHTHLADYLSLFLVSSVVAVIPFTIGGVGARELVFIFGYQYLPIDKNAAIAFTLLFFLITALSSLTGIFFNEKESKKGGEILQAQGGTEGQGNS